MLALSCESSAQHIRFWTNTVITMVEETAVKRKSYIKAIAGYFGVHYSTVSRAVAEYEGETQ